MMPNVVRRCGTTSSFAMMRGFMARDLLQRHPLSLRCGRRPLGSTAPATEPLALVYQSPLGNVVSKLRTVSLVTAIIGSTGVPCMIAIKGAIPEMGMLAVAMMFVTGSIGSTAAIHFVFSPYVYRIEFLPIRQCSSPSETTAAAIDVTVANSAAASEASDGSTSEATTATVFPSKPPKDALLRAWTRSLFLRHHEIVFDPEIDVVPYKGLRPLCNFVAKGVPLYVHPEYVYDEKLRKAMNLSVQNFAAAKANPDDDLL